MTIRGGMSDITQGGCSAKKRESFRNRFQFEE